MFDLLEGTIDQQLARERAACWREIGEIVEREALGKQRLMELARQANARGDWKAAGFASPEQWLAGASRSSHQTAKLMTETAEALAELPALDEGLKSGKLTYDQTTAAVEHATPETDAELARVAPGKAPGEISRFSRQLNPPRVEDDQELYRRRKLSMAWTNGKRELLVHARLPLEQGLAFENAIWSDAKARRAIEKRDGIVLDWQQSAVDALVALVTRTATGSGAKRPTAQLVVHVSDDTPPMLEGAGPISPQTAERLTCGQPRLYIKHDGDDTLHATEGRLASDPQKRAMHHRSPHCQYPGCTATRDLEHRYRTLDIRANVIVRTFERRSHACARSEVDNSINLLFADSLFDSFAITDIRNDKSHA